MKRVDFQQIGIGGGGRVFTWSLNTTRSDVISRLIASADENNNDQFESDSRFSRFLRNE